MFRIMNRRGTICPDVFEMLPVRQYICEFKCGRVYKDRFPYEKHLKNVHNVDINDTMKYKCPKQACNYRGKCIRTIRQHFQKEHMDKNFQCEFCSRTFVSQTTLNNHYCGFQNFQCTACFKICKSLTMQNNHYKKCILYQNKAAQVTLPETMEKDSDDEQVLPATAPKGERKRKKENVDGHTKIKKRKKNIKTNAKTKVKAKKRQDDDKVIIKKKKKKIKANVTTIDTKENDQPDEMIVPTQEIEKEPDVPTIEESEDIDLDAIFSLEEIEKLLRDMDAKEADQTLNDDPEEMEGIASCYEKLCKETEHMW